MRDIFSSDSVNSKMTSFIRTLSKAKWTEIKRSEVGHIFTDDYLASNWDNIDVCAEQLPLEEAQIGMRKITSPTLLLKSHSPKMAFIMASEVAPVYICSACKRGKFDGYTMLFSLKPHIHPDFIFYMSKYKSWTSISIGIDEGEKYGLGIGGFGDVGICNFDGVNENIISAEDVFLNCLGSDILVPALSEQLQQIEDAKMMEQVMHEKFAEQERKFQQKEWLNETHIRNIKHRISNDLFPIRLAVERLEEFITCSSDGVKISTIVGQATSQSVGGLLENLIKSIGRVEEDVKMLTETEIAGSKSETVEVECFIRNICRKFESGQVLRNFNICINVLDNDLKIKIPRNSLETVINNILSNAVHHGFTDKNREDYIIDVTLSETSEGNCRIDIANNGSPMSERGRELYFVRGSVAGETGNTGIGGALVYEICDKFHGKAISPYSTEDFPVVVSVEFPIV